MTDISVPVRPCPPQQCTYSFSPLKTRAQQSSASRCMAVSVVTLPSMIGRCRKSIFSCLMRECWRSCALDKIRCASLMYGLRRCMSDEPYKLWTFLQFCLNASATPVCKVLYTAQRQWHRVLRCVLLASQQDKYVLTVRAMRDWKEAHDHPRWGRVQHLRPRPDFQVWSLMLMFTSACRHTNVVMPSSSRVVKMDRVSASSTLAG